MIESRLMSVYLANELLPRLEQEYPNSEPSIRARGTSLARIEFLGDAGHANRALNYIDGYLAGRGNGLPKPPTVCI